MYRIHIRTFPLTVKLDVLLVEEVGKRVQEVLEVGVELLAALHAQHPLHHLRAAGGLPAAYLEVIAWNKRDIG